MITSEIVEALELFESLLQDDTQQQAVTATREMLCEWSEDDWRSMDSAEKQRRLLPFLPDPHEHI